MEKSPLLIPIKNVKLENFESTERLIVAAYSLNPGEDCNTEWKIPTEIARELGIPVNQKELRLIASVLKKHFKGNEKNYIRLLHGNVRYCVKKIN